MPGLSRASALAGMLLALVFVLARNVVKLLVERRRAIPFVRFRAKLVFVLLGIAPALFIAIGSANLWGYDGRAAWTDAIATGDRRDD